MAKVLIIEDDPLMIRMYKKIFTFDGYTVETAGDGEEGLTKIRSFMPTIVLLDVMMPKLNGLEVLAKIKSDPDLKKIPVVMLTNLAGQQDIDKALEMGAIKYIVKSEYDPKQISDMVKEIISANTRGEVPKSAANG
jgi:CheY-like chemotaxis protein